VLHVHDEWIVEVVLGFNVAFVIGRSLSLLNDTFVVLGSTELEKTHMHDQLAYCEMNWL